MPKVKAKPPVVTSPATTHSDVSVQTTVVRSQASRLKPSRLAVVGFGLLVIAAVVLFFVYPTYPTYDPYYALVWGRELAHGLPPSLDGYRTPTQHPLSLLVAILLTPFGDGADRALVGLNIASLLMLVWGIYRLSRISFTAMVGVLAVLLLLTRLDFAFLAVRGFIDIPYLAALVWAAVLEAEKPRRGTPVLVLLVIAGLMRPEAWLLICAYFIWIIWAAPWKRRFLYVGLAAIGPLVWIGIDYFATGNPIFSLTHTTGLAEELQRSRSVSELPNLTVEYLIDAIKLPVLLASMVGFGLAVFLVPKRAVMGAILFLCGVGTFVLVGLAGLSMIPRYLSISSIPLIIFAAVAGGGWSMLTKGLIIRRIWVIVAALCALFVAGFTLNNLNFIKIHQELSFRSEAHVALTQILDNPKVKAGLKCGPLSVPNHKLIPEVRWITGWKADRIIARTSLIKPNQQHSELLILSGRAQHGVALFPLGVDSLWKSALTNPEHIDTSLVQVPPMGFQPVAVNDYFAAYVSC